MRNGRRIGLDPGTVRVGVAVSDFHGLLATAREPLPAGDVESLDALIVEVDPIEIVVGLPLGMDGSRGAAAAKASEFARTLAERAFVPVRLVDERLSTVQAQRGFHDQGRSVRQSRGMIDSAAAEVVLQHALDTERASGQAPGEVCTKP